MGIQNIFDAEGFGIAATGLTIVFVALTMISVFIALLPRAMGMIDTVFPEDHHGHCAPAKKGATEEEVIAAIGFALHHRGRPPN